MASGVMHNETRDVSPLLSTLITTAKAVMSTHVIWRYDVIEIYQAYQASGNLTCCIFCNNAILCHVIIVLLPVT